MFAFIELRAGAPNRWKRPPTGRIMLEPALRASPIAVIGAATPGVMPVDELLLQPAADKAREVDRTAVPKRKRTRMRPSLDRLH